MELINPAKLVPPILIVDDEEDSLSVLEEQLNCEGYSVVKTTDAKTALDHLVRETFSVIIADQRMPRMSGLEFFRKAKDLRPNAMRVLITGALSIEIVVDA